MDCDTLQTLREIEKACETCQVYAPKQFVFRVRDRDSIRFNQNLLVDIMYLKDEKGTKNPVLHLINAGTRFQAAAFLPTVDENTVWNTFFRI